MIIERKQTDEQKVSGTGGEIAYNLWVGNPGTLAVGGAYHCNTRETRCLTPQEADSCALNPNAVNAVKDERVHHPQHYGGDTVYEVIKVLRAWLTPEEYVGALKFNVIKYLAWARLKSGAEDYAKAAWYQEELARFTRGEKR